ncbi:CrcB family protein [Blastococcus sp. LR1]|uniref:fluoride efflux transporter FluC n=1 Tax=Blastococcus sp. LR1 TaxID=2877000 RepID=UPI001CCACD92|nr:CrcB family protein [Blastococcus sp. LR1]MCA0147147.1 CrcB family protein [Blastococcus sp. LR1]
MTPLLVALGAAVGAPLRLLITRAVVRAGGDPSWGTLAVNVVGSALLGGLLGLADVSAAAVALIGTGFCGTLTTFATLGADLARAVEERALRRALISLGGHLVLGLGAAAVVYLAVNAS